MPLWCLEQAVLISHTSWLSHWIERLRCCRQWDITGRVVAWQLPWEQSASPGCTVSYGLFCLYSVCYNTTQQVPLTWGCDLTQHVPHVGRLAILFNSPPKPEACWTVEARINVRSSYSPSPSKPSRWGYDLTQQVLGEFYPLHDTCRHSRE